MDGSRRYQKGRDGDTVLFGQMMRICSRHGLPLWLMALSFGSVIYMSWLFYLSALSSPMELLMENIDRRVVDLTVKFNSLERTRNISVIHSLSARNSNRSSLAGQGDKLQLEIDMEIGKLRADIGGLSAGRMELKNQFGVKVSSKSSVLSRSTNSRPSSKFVSSVSSLWKADPVIDGLSYPQIVAQGTQPYTLEEVQRLANVSSVAKGQVIQYDNEYRMAGVGTEGQYFRYVHSYNDPCLVGFRAVFGILSHQRLLCRFDIYL
jgi:hypothetical protein